MVSSFYLYGGDYWCSTSIDNYHVLCHCGMQGAASALSLKTVHRTVFTCEKFVPNFSWHSLRLKHSRLALYLQILPQPPCFGSSSNFFNPSPTAVVLVTFDSNRYHYIYVKKTRTPVGILVLFIWWRLLESNQ